MICSRSATTSRPTPSSGTAPQRHLRHPAGACRTHPRTGAAGRPQPGRHADGARRDQGAAREPAPRSRHETLTAGDLVDRMFTREAPNRLWVTDIIEHRTYERKVYYAVVLDAFSRRVVGWSIDSSQTATLVTNALEMAIANRDPEPGVIVHSDSAA